MVQPYNINIPNPGEQMLAGIQAGQDYMIKYKAQQEQARMQEDLANLSQKKNRSAEDIQAMMVKYPVLSKQLDQSLQALNTQQKEARINQLTPIYMALRAGNTDLANNQVDELIAAYQNSGNEFEARNLETLKSNIELDPQGAILSSEFLLAKEDPERFKKISEAQAKFGEEKRAEALQPGEIKKQQAEIIKFGVDNDLTKQEALRTAAQTKKLGAETQKIVMEMEAMNKKGELDPEKKFDQERKLAGEYQKGTSDFVKVQDAYRRVQSVENTPAGDVALIFNYMKMLDPGSTVREGEFATAEQTTGIPGRIVNLYNKALEGKRLAPNQIKQFMSQSKGLMNAAKKREQEVRSGLTKVAQNYGLNADNIFVGAPTEEKQPESTPSGQQAPQVFNTMAEAEQASMNLPKGTRLQVGNKIFEVE